MKKLLCVLILTYCAFLCFAQKSTKIPPKVEKTMPFSKGVNLSLWLEDNGAGNVFLPLGDRQDFEDMKTLGVDIVRLPVSFEEFSSGKPDYIVEDWLWERIDSAVEWCTELEIYLIIDFHNNCKSDSKTRPDINDILIKIWSQIAERYKNSSKYIIYEIMNEPHFKSGQIEADISKWNRIQGNVLKIIREIDNAHTVIVGAEGSNSMKYLLRLPDYKDNNIIYNFHDYTPFVFTSQGTHADTRNVKHIPFPYIKEKMPPIPKKVPPRIKQELQNYAEISKESNLVKPYDEAVNFANKRSVALMCNEYGVDMTYADSEERINWYRLKAKWLDERNITRISWDYRAAFGLFKNKSYTARFPEELNIEIIEAMGYEVPKMESRKRYSWFENAKKNNDYSIFNGGCVKGIYMNAWDVPNTRINKKDSVDGEEYINIPRTEPWGGGLSCLFSESCDFSDLVNSGKVLEFEARTVQRNINMQVYFEDTEIPDNGKQGFAWRCQTIISDNHLPADGNWHKISIPLKEFADIGAWNDYEKKWYNSEGLFRWSKVNRLSFAFPERSLQNDVSIRNIVIK